MKKELLIFTIIFSILFILISGCISNDDNDSNDKENDNQEFGNPVTDLSFEIKLLKNIYSINESIYRQADNIFLFNFTNENDLTTVSKATMVDVETVNIIAKELPPRYCLILGKAVNDFPLIMKVNSIPVKTMGQTRLFFTNLKRD